MKTKSLSLILLLSFAMIGCNNTLQTIKTELFFGLNDGVEKRNLSVKEWESFVQNQIAPQFKEGFTILNDCKGAWFSEISGFGTEDCRILIVTHRSENQMENKLKTIMDSYKKQFHQEAVLRLDTKVNFELY